MSTDLRDTQFLGFARVLWDELEAAIQRYPGFIPEGETRRAVFLPMIHTLLAQRAYDLVHHTLEIVPQLIAVAPDAQEIDEVIGFVPDLPVLPERSK